MTSLKRINGTTLKVLAMITMLCDHLWGIGLVDSEWLHIVGRLAFPIFAFLITEGYAHTKDFKAYCLRLLGFALISEIPFNLMMGSLIYPFHQNVMFTFLLALLLLRGLERLLDKCSSLVIKAILVALFAFLGYALGNITFVDYYGYGILTVFLFHFTREKRWGWLVQLVGMWYINWVLISGFSFTLHFMGWEILFPLQAFALLALLPIWLYNGQRGPGGKAFQYFTYAFYPAHILVLVLLVRTMGY